VGWLHQLFEGVCAHLVSKGHLVSKMSRGLEGEEAW